MNLEYWGLFLSAIRIHPALDVFILALVIFTVSLKIVHGPLKNYNNREIRRALTITITIIYFALLALSVTGELPTNEVSLSLVNGLNEVFMVTVAFYFGSRAVEEGIRIHRESSNRK